MSTKVREKKGIIVTKFGGSSVADVIQLEKIKDIMDMDPERKYLVTSAPGKRFDGDSKVTDLLYLCKSHIEHNLPYEQIFQVVTDRFTALKMNLGLEIDLTQHYEKIKRRMREGATIDYLASRGEYLSAVILAAYLGFDFVDAQSFIKFDESGRLLLEETDIALREELSKHDKAVLPGFYGSTPDGKVKIFSRGGSDVTGALVSRAVDADVYENWTDVSGFLVASPVIVQNPSQIDYISYKELRELSYMGATVLHEDAIHPVKIANIPINIRNTNDPAESGTYITSDYVRDASRIVTGIAGQKDFIVIAIQKSMMTSEKGFIRRLLGVLEDYEITIERIPSGIDNVSLVINKEDVKDRLEEVLNEMQRRANPDKIEVFDHMALIAVVGEGMTGEKGVASKVFTALAKSDINIRLIDQGSSEINITVGVENHDFEKAIRAIYKAFY